MLPTQRRKRNFTDEETTLILKFVVRNYRKLHGLPPYSTSATEKAALWQQLATAGTALGEDDGTATDISKKW